MFKIGDEVIYTSTDSKLYYVQIKLNNPDLKTGDMYEIYDIHHSSILDDDDSPYYTLKDKQNILIGWIDNRNFHNLFISSQEYRKQKIKKILFI